MLRLLFWLSVLALESAVKLAAEPLVRLGAFIYRAWTANKVGEKLFPKWAERRKRKRRLRELGIPEEGSMAIDLGTRTSTNALVGGGFLSQVYVQLVSLLPGEGAIETLLLQPEAIAFAAVLLATVIARFSKTPATPGKL